MNAVMNRLALESRIAEWRKEKSGRPNLSLEFVGRRSIEKKPQQEGNMRAIAKSHPKCTIQISGSPARSGH
jgi:hypothetical protein